MTSARASAQYLCIASSKQVESTASTSIFSVTTTATSDASSVRHDESELITSEPASTQDNYDPEEARPAAVPTTKTTLKKDRKDNQQANVHKRHRTTTEYATLEQHDVNRSATDVVTNGHDALYGSLPLESASTTRVLKIMLAEPGDVSDPLACVMSIISLDTPPDYHAVSYVWGEPDPSNSYTISINGVPLIVRPSIWKFLNQMQSERFEGLLWVDAICINQNDLPERGHQVAVMGQIYKRATMVHAWLGDKGEGTQLAMHQIATTDWGAVWDAIMKDKRDHWSDKDFASVSQIWNCEYWTRLWVVPEFVMAKEITIRCGSHQMQGELLEKLVDNTGALSILPKEKRWQMPTKPSTRLGLQIVKERLNRLRSQMLFAEDFAHILTSLGRGYCADNRDRMYAFLSFSLLVSNQLKPDYTKTILQIFIEVCDAELGDYRYTHRFRHRGAGSWVTTLLQLREVAEMLGLKSDCEELYFLFPERQLGHEEAQT